MLLLFLFSLMWRGSDGGVLSAALVRCITLGCLPLTMPDISLTRALWRLLFPNVRLGGWQPAWVCRASSHSCLKYLPQLSHAERADFCTLPESFLLEITFSTELLLIFTVFCPAAASLTIQRSLTGRLAVWGVDGGGGGGSCSAPVFSLAF